MADDMTSAPVTAAELRNEPPRARISATWRTYLPGAAGVAYLAAWIAGLAVWPVNLALNATAAQTVASYAAHPAGAVTQYLLAEGLAGLLLAPVLGSALFPRLGARTGKRTWSRAAVTAAGFGAVAVAVSLTQCVLGLILTSAATGHDVATSGDLSSLVNQLDGVKMLALAVTAVSLAAVKSPGRALPRWLRVTALLLAVALAASGYAYLTLTNALAWTAFVSGLLLLLWVTGTGIALTVRRRTLPSPTARP
jgi:hypothetical protein